MGLNTPEGCRDAPQAKLAENQELVRIRDAEIAVRDFVLSLKRVGADRLIVSAALSDLHACYVEAGDEERTDAVADVLDLMTGWCSSHARIWTEGS